MSLDSVTDVRSNISNKYLLRLAIYSKYLLLINFDIFSLHRVPVVKKDQLENLEHLDKMYVYITEKGSS